MFSWQQRGLWGILRGAWYRMGSTGQKLEHRTLRLDRRNDFFHHGGCQRLEERLLMLSKEFTTQLDKALI